MELHGANEFKIRGYQNAIQRLERIHDSIAELNEKQLQEIDGLGKSIAGNINEISTTGTTALLTEYEQNTPSGLRELMQFRGIGIKKLKTLINGLKRFGLEIKESQIRTLSKQLISFVREYKKREKRNKQNQDQKRMKVEKLMK